MRAGDVHKHVAERFGDAFGMSAAGGQAAWLTLVRCVVGDDVD
jgi:hypothetical protein